MLIVDIWGHLWYGKFTMTETPTPPNKYPFNMKAAAEKGLSTILNSEDVNPENASGFLAQAKAFQEKHPITSNIISLGVVAAAIGGGVKIVTTELTQPNASQQEIIDANNATEARPAAYAKSIAEAINANYDSRSVIGEIDISQNSTLLDPSVNAVITHIGQAAYDVDKSKIFNSLMSSTLSFNPQPGEKYAVVETGINTQIDTGIEYVTVPMTHIVVNPNNSIPAPQEIGQNIQLPTLPSPITH
jgi:hypothetical protein